MPASTLTHKKLAPVSPASSTSSDVIAALYTALTATLDYAGHDISAFQMTGVTKETIGGRDEAVQGSFPAAAVAGMKALWAAKDPASATPNPTTLTPDTAGTDRLYNALVRGGGAYAGSPAWNGAGPWTTGNYSKLWRGAVATNVTMIQVYITGETIWVVTQGTANATIYAAACGALWNPGVQSAPSSEMSGRRIGMITSGGAVLNAMGRFWNPPADVNNLNSCQFLDHNSGDGNPHAAVMAIGSATMTGVMRAGFLRNKDNNATQGPSHTGVLDGGELARWAAPPYCYAGAGILVHNIVGQLREVHVMGDAINGARLQVAGVDVGFVIASDKVGTSQAMLLAA